MPNYELISNVDFGVVRNEKGEVKQASEQPTLHGEHPAGSVLNLTEEQAAPLLAAGAVKPEGVAEPFRNDSPEEHGYQGEEVRNKAMKEDEVYTKSREKASGKAKG